MQTKKSICICIGVDQVRKIDSDPLTHDLGRSGIFRLMINEFFKRRDGERVVDAKQSEAKHK